MILNKMGFLESIRKAFLWLTDLEFFGWFIIFLISSGIIAADRFTPICLNNFYLRLFFYIVSGSLLLFWVSWILFGFKAIRARIYIFGTVVILCYAKALYSWNGDWSTQTILYHSKSSTSETIERQIRQDRFAFGYNNRIVERKKFIPYVDYISDIDTTNIDPAIWQRID